MFRHTLIVLLFTLTLATTALAQAPTIFVVRHAERADAGMTPASGADPDLSQIGRERAESLATLLKHAHITAIYTTEFKRTQQTAAPLAKTLGLVAKIVPSTNTADLRKQLKASKGNVLVVGHSNTVPDIVKGLGVPSAVTVGDDEFDNLFVVTLGAKPTVLRLHYK